MGIDIMAGGRKATKKSGRTAPKSENLYLRLLVKLYRFLSRRTDAKFNATVLKRLMSSNTNKPQLSIKGLAKFAGMEANAGKTLVVVGPVTDDVANSNRAGEAMYERVIKRLREELSDEGAERRRLQAQLNDG